jgi:hypothetical protein
MTVIDFLRHHAPRAPSVLLFGCRQRRRRYDGVNRNVTTSPSCIT